MVGCITIVRSSPLRIKLDENLPVEAAVVLRPLGHDVDTVDDEDMLGRPTRMRCVPPPAKGDC